MTLTFPTFLLPGSSQLVVTVFLSPGSSLLMVTLFLSPGSCQLVITLYLSPRPSLLNVDDSSLLKVPVIKYLNAHHRHWVSCKSHAMTALAEQLHDFSTSVYSFLEIIESTHVSSDIL